MWGNTGGRDGVEQEDTKRAAREQDDGSSSGSSSSTSDLRAGAKSKDRRCSSSKPSTLKKQKTENEKQHGASREKKCDIIHANRLDNDSLLRGGQIASGMLDGVGITNVETTHSFAVGSPLRFATSGGAASRDTDTLPFANMRTSSSLSRLQSVARMDDMHPGVGPGHAEIHNLSEALSLQQRLAQERLFQEQLLSSRSQHRRHHQQRQVGFLEQNEQVARQQQLLQARGLLQRQQDLDDLEEMVRRRINSDRPPALSSADDIGERLSRFQRLGLLSDRLLQQERPVLSSWERQRSALQQQLLGQQQSDPPRESSQFLDVLAARRSPRTTDNSFHDPSGTGALAAALRGSSVADSQLGSLDSSRLLASVRSNPFAGVPAASLQRQSHQGLSPPDLLMLQRQRLISCRRLDEQSAGAGSNTLAFRDRLRPAQHNRGSLIGRREASSGGISYLDIPHRATHRGELPATLARPDDNKKLSSHQVFLRHQIEAFQASADDVMTHTRGRNKPIRLKQVGIRCRHCAELPVSHRQKGSAYFPATLMGVYQAAQNMGTTHLQCGLCHAMPIEYKDEFARLLSTKSSSSGAGRPFWADSARELGLVDTNQGIYLRGDVPEGVSIIEPDRAE